ncbi:hypothetical protein EDB81DRAFT_632939 [Dactylonectria macrodidyma]|uniref:DUF7924 domain-containing protein n=1 Tax=Dactylonectria macrodidyma TaxID=307937 RepID=A0A9P9FST1_9HYPO|nr:hypothetical protein EDB81DRAFT_632939 [Dactylonectria macrodidyma]
MVAINVFDSSTYCSEPPLPPVPVQEDEDSDDDTGHDLDSDDYEEPTEECISVASGFFQTSNIPATQSLVQTQEQKISWYVDPRYEWILAAKDVFMKTCLDGISEESADLLQHLRRDRVALSSGRAYHEIIMKEAKGVCWAAYKGKKQAVVVRSQEKPLILLPSLKKLAAEKKELLALIESANEPWTSCIPLAGAFPQPAYAVGFRREAFSTSELARLSALFGDPVTGQPSIVLATHGMYFSFLTCEARTADPWLNMADRQNAHSAAISVGGVVELFRAAGLAHEINREILAFSVSHDQKVMRIYGHYPVISGDRTAYYRYPINSFSVAPENGMNTWSAYKFFINVYDTWTMDHLAKLRWAINQLPLPPNPDAAIADAYHNAAPQAVVSRGFASHSAVSQSVVSQNVSHAAASHAALPQPVVGPVRPPISQDSRARFDFCFSGLTGRLQGLQGFQRLEELQ